MQLQIDFTGPLPQIGDGNNYALVVVDSFTKCVEAFPTCNNTAVTPAKVLLEQTISQVTLLITIDSNQRPHFVGYVMRCLCQALNIRQKFNVAAHL